MCKKTPSIRLIALLLFPRADEPRSIANGEFLLQGPPLDNSADITYSAAV
ncbi:MAG: hypothetical protein ACYTBX_10830 [Planctomycetota bacterium]|jgi:hypothetical protein